MTAKRFVIFQDSYDDLYIQDKEVYRATGIKVGNEEDVKYKNVSKIVEILNALNEENEQLRTALKELKEIGDYQADRIQELSDENAELKHSIKCLEADKMELQQYIKRMQGDVE